MTTDRAVRDRLKAAADPIRIDADATLTAFHDARPRRDRIRRVATIVTALGLAALAFAITWIATPVGHGSHGTPVPGASGVTGGAADVPSGTIAYMVIGGSGDHETSSLATVDLGTGDVEALDSPTAFTSYPVWSPDGSRVAYAGGDDYGTLRLIVADADGSNAHDVGTQDLGGPVFAWSPDGAKLAYVGGETTDSATNAIRIVNVDGTDDLVVLPGLEWQSVSWSPDATHLVVVGHPPSPDFVAGPDGWDIYTVAVDGSGLRQLTETKAFEHAASWSPDGSEILFTRSDYSDDADYDQDIWVMNADGSNERRLTDWRGFDAFPVWSPDGRWIAFASDRDSTPEQQTGFRTGKSFDGVSIYVMRSDGSDADQVATPSEGTTLVPGSWRPN
jgi:Tol biopolymer transport system component